jgi:hypothetical protein
MFLSLAIGRGIRFPNWRPRDSSQTRFLETVPLSHKTPKQLITFKFPGLASPGAIALNFARR